MAITHRCGSFKDFYPSKLLPGELAVVLDGDPRATNGRSLYACYRPGVVKQIATYEDMLQFLKEAMHETAEQLREELAEEFTEKIFAAINEANTAAQAADEIRKSVEELITQVQNDSEKVIKDAVDAAKAANDAAEAANASAQEGKNYEGILATFPENGKEGITYIDVETNQIYRWDVTTEAYIPVGGAGGSGGSSLDILLTLPSTDWTGEAAPYELVITVPQMRETMTPLLFFSGVGDEAQYAYSLITGYKAGYAQMTFYVADLPVVDIDITLKGIPAQQLEYADNTVVVVVPVDGFTLNEDLGRYEQTITVEGMTPGMGGLFDIVRSGPVLTLEESKIVASITDIIRLDGAIKIVCLEPPAQQYMLALYGTFTQATEGTTLLAGMQGWFDRVEELEKGSLFYVDYKLTITANSDVSVFSAYGVMNVSVASATPVSAQIIGGSNFYGSVTLNVNSGSLYVYGVNAGEYTIRVLYVHTS